MPGKSDHQVFFGLLMGIIAIILVLGSITTALAEGTLVTAGEAAAGRLIEADELIFPTSDPTSDLITSSTPTPSIQIPLEREVIPATPTPAAITSTAEITPHVCPPPGGWYVITAQDGETLSSIAEKYHTPPENLSKANCLTNTATISPGTIVYVPGPPIPAGTSCSVPSGWSKYTVQSGDTLNLLGQRTSTTALKIQEGNCLESSTLIRVGQTLYLPTVSGAPTPAPWNSLTPAYIYPSVTYQPLTTEIPTLTYLTPYPTLEGSGGTPASQFPPPSTTSPGAATSWPTSMPWPSATAE